MTATNICYNFVGFRCSPPVSDIPLSLSFSEHKISCIPLSLSFSEHKVSYIPLSLSFSGHKASYTPFSLSFQVQMYIQRSYIKGQEQNLLERANSLVELQSC